MKLIGAGVAFFGLLIFSEQGIGSKIGGASLMLVGAEQMGLLNLKGVLHK